MTRYGHGNCCAASTGGNFAQIAQITDLDGNQSTLAHPGTGEKKVCPAYSSRCADDVEGIRAHPSSPMRKTSGATTLAPESPPRDNVVDTRLPMRSTVLNG